MVMGLMLLGLAIMGFGISWGIQHEVPPVAVISGIVGTLVYLVGLARRRR